MRNLRNLNTKYETKIVVVIVGCSDKELTEGAIVENDRRKRMGMTNSFRNNCKQILELLRSALFSNEASGDVNESKSTTSCDGLKAKTELQNLITIIWRIFQTPYPNRTVSLECLYFSQPFLDLENQAFVARSLQSRQRQCSKIFAMT